MSEKVHKTEKGTLLPLLNLKGKLYMMVAYRMVWFREVHPLGMMETQILKVDDSTAIVKAIISVPIGDGSKIIKLAEATKREDMKHFPDFLEKAETGALGRALALAGFGTQFAIPELEEDMRLADSPLESVKKEQVSEKSAEKYVEQVKEFVEEKKTEEKKPRFRKPKEKAVVTPAQESEWG